MAEQIFGSTITNSAGRVVPVRQIGERHVIEDIGRIPTAADWLRAIKVEPWMLRHAKEMEDGLWESRTPLHLLRHRRVGDDPGPGSTRREGAGIGRLITHALQFLYTPLRYEPVTLV